MAGYIQIFTKTPGDRIDAEDFNDEFELVSNAFNATIGHTHDGSAGNGSYVPLIADEDKHNAIEVNGNLNEIVLSIDVSNVKEEQFTISDGLVEPRITDDVQLGTAANRFGEIHSAGVRAGLLNLSGSGDITVVLDEGDFASNSAQALVTQRSAKQYIDDTVLAAPGLFRQSKIVRRASDQALSGAMADYLLATITVEEGAYVTFFAQATAQGTNYIGNVQARLYRDSTALGFEDSYVAGSEATTNFFGSTTLLEHDGPLTAGTYTYKIKMREQSTDGIALGATIILLEGAGS